MPSDSMNIGVTGLDAYQAQIDVISNNIANVGTTAYKSQGLSFQDLLYQTQQPASGPTKTNAGVNYQQIGIGVKVGSTDTNMLQGGVQTTGVNTNLMINGDGYFMLANADGTGTPKYTRNGNFSLNETGLLFDPSSGLGVMGYAADTSGKVVEGAPGPIQIPIGLKSQATATGQGVKNGPAGDKVFDVSYGGNIDSTQYASAAAVVASGGVSPVTLATAGTTIYDSLGGPHLVQITFQPQLSSGGVGGLPAQVSNVSGAPITAATEWAYTLSSTDGTLFNQSTAATATNAGASVSPVQYAFFDQNGHYINTSSSAVATTASVHLANGLPSVQTGNQISVTQWGVPANANNSAILASVAPGPIGIDFSGMTADAATTELRSTYQDGYPPGTLSNMSVSQDGTILGAFTNGQSVTLGRVALATFQNEEGLVRTGSSQYAESPDSGQAQLGTANGGRFGAIVGDSLELSNVSIADEFTKLITAQNAFTANSKSITTANTDMQTVIGLIR